MKYALKNAVILDGTKDMEPLRGQSVLVEGETIVGLVPAGSEPQEANRWVLSRSI